MKLISKVLSIILLAALGALAGSAEDSAWTPLGDGKFTPPKDGNYPSLIGSKLIWVPGANKAVIVPAFARLEADYWECSFENPVWERKKGTHPKDLVPDRSASPLSYCYMPGLKKILYLKQEWWYSRSKKKLSGWLMDPVSGTWEGIEAKVSMADASSAFNPVKGKDGMRLPLWGQLIYDAHNKEALAFGGGGTWGRVGKIKQSVGPGDWIYDETAKRTRRLTADDAGKISEARRWFPAHCGSWTFSESEKVWKAIEQPLGQQPGGRILPGMVYVPDARKVVLFGGDDLARCFNDTWIYDCESRTWSEVKPETSPGPRAGHAMVYVPETQSVLMCGGYTGGWQGLGDVWTFSLKDRTWTCIGAYAKSGEGRKATFKPRGLALPGRMAYCSGVYLPQKKTVLMACYPGTSRNKSIKTYTLNLKADVAAVTQEKVDPKQAYHCKGQGAASTLLPEEWTAGANVPGDPEAGLKEIKALPANTWVQRKPPVGSRARGWGHTAYDTKTHTGIAWGGGHSTYPGAEISEYNVLTNRWRSMAQATNYNPVWLHGMVGGPPGVSFGGWSLLPTHARKSYTIDHASGKAITYVGDVYDFKTHAFVTNIGKCPGKYGVASQVSFVPTPHGLYGYSAGTLAKPNVKAGKWEIVAKGGPSPHSEHSHLSYDSKRDQLVYFDVKKKKVWTFGLKEKVWAEQKPAGGLPPAMTADSTYIPEMDAVLLVFGKKGGSEETMYFYKIGERKWYSSPYKGEKVWRVNTGLNYSPRYDPELKTVVRFTMQGHRWIGVFLLRLDPASLPLTPIEGQIASTKGGKP